DIDDGTGYRLAVDADDPTFHHHQFAALRVALVEPHFEFGERRTGNVERPFDGARRAGGAAGAAVRFVGADVEQAIEAEARSDEPVLPGLAEAREPVDTGPEFVRADVEIVDGAEQVADDSRDDLLKTRIAARPVRFGHAFEQLGLSEFVHVNVSFKGAWVAASGCGW